MYGWPISVERDQSTQVDAAASVEQTAGWCRDMKEWLLGVAQYYYCSLSEASDYSMMEQPCFIKQRFKTWAEAEAEYHKNSIPITDDRN